MLTREVLCHGSEAPLTDRVALRAGPLSMWFERGNAFLRRICLGEREVVRAIYVAVRDRNWVTIAPQVHGIQVDARQDSFRIRFEVECREREIDFHWRGAISGDGRGTITYGMEGEARSTFLRNRIGFCVLHPMRECAGQPCLIECVDDVIEEGDFPLLISPHQPFTEIRAIRHHVMPGLAAEVRFEGDTFEMEDQRNWTDASFKTYSTPLRLPYPVGIAAGTRVSQSVKLSLHGRRPDRRLQARLTAGSAPTLRVSGAGAVPLARIGLGVASHGETLSDRELARLRVLRPAHLRVDLHLATPEWESALRRAVGEADVLGAGLEAALFVTDEADRELAALRRLVDRALPAVERWLVFHEDEKSTTERWVTAAQDLLGDYDVGAPIAAGTDAEFVEINRRHPPLDAVDAVCYSVNPQVHTYDDTAVMENAHGQAPTVETAKEVAPGVPIAVTPITLRRRRNPDAQTPPGEDHPHVLPRPVDARQMSLFGAAWTLASLRSLLDAGASSLTYYETTGWRGVMEREGGSPLPDVFPSLPGAVYPLYHVLADVAGFSEGGLTPVVASRRNVLDGLALARGDERRLLVANLTPEEQWVKLHGLPPRVILRALDEVTAERAMTDPEGYRAEAGVAQETDGGSLELRLRAYAYLRVDGLAVE